MPDRTPEEFREHIESVGISTRLGDVKRTDPVKVTPVANGDGPGVAGHQTEHWDGRVDATVTPATVIATPTYNQAGD